MPSSTIAGHILPKSGRRGRYRRFTPLSRDAARFPIYTVSQDGAERDITVWSSNDYLAMGVDPVTIDGARAALETLGAGAGGTRNIGGTSPLHDALEAELASLHGKDAALLFSSGFVSNQASLAAILRSLPGWHVLLRREEPCVDDRRDQGRSRNPAISSGTTTSRIWRRCWRRRPPPRPS